MGPWFLTRPWAGVRSASSLSACSAAFARNFVLLSLLANSDIICKFQLLADNSFWFDGASCGMVSDSAVGSGLVGELVECKFFVVCR